LLADALGITIEELHDAREEAKAATIEQAELVLDRPGLVLNTLQGLRARGGV
jgi:hypothetical protein